MDYQAMVREFHEKYGHAIKETPGIGVAPELCFLRIRLMKEELHELELAMLHEDLGGVADNLADLAYVVFGTALTYGIPLDAAFAEVHRSNMTKLVPPAKALHEKYPEGFNPKGPGYEPPDIAQVLYRAITGAPQSTSEASET